MLLLLLTVSTVLCGFCAGFDDDMMKSETCFGKDFTFPHLYTPPLYSGPIYFTPSTGGPDRLVMDNEKPIHPRLRVSHGFVILHDITEEDDGHFSVTFDQGRRRRIATLKVLSCSDPVRRDYGSTYKYRITRRVEFLEFTPFHSLNQPKILWNRTDPEVNAKSRVQVTGNVLRIPNVTQRDDGYYNFREKTNRLVSRLHFMVEELTRTLLGKDGKYLLVKYPWSFDTWNVTFTPEETSDDVLIIEDGRIVKDNWFRGRLSVGTEGLDIIIIESGDVGSFQFKDPEGNLVMRVYVEVESDYKTIFYIIPAVVIILLLICCCCCFCCKKKKKSTSSVVYLGQTQLPGQSYSAAPSSSSAFSYQPVNVPNESTGTSRYTPVTRPAAQQSNVVPPLSILSSDREPTFEVKGMTSALPLSSDTALCDVYTSDKLNFP